MDVEDLIDRLYGLPLAEFTAARNEAARELRTAGQRDDAERVKALRRPTAAAGAVNQMVREHRDEVERFLVAAGELRDAQLAATGDLAAATRREHEALGRLVRYGGEDVRQSLLAAAVDDDAARELLAARLERELEPRGFGTLLAHAPTAAGPALSRHERPPHASPAGTARARPPVVEPSTAATTTQPSDAGVARTRLQNARIALGKAEAEEGRARRRREQADRELERSRAAAEKAREAAEKAAATAEAARAAAGEAAAAATGARREVEKAQRDLDRLTEAQDD